MSLATDMSVNMRGLIAPSTLGDVTFNGADPALADLGNAAPAFITGATGSNALVKDITDAWQGIVPSVSGPVQPDATAVTPIARDAQGWWNAQPWTVQTAFVLLAMAIVLVGLVGVAISSGAASTAAKAAAA